MGAERAFVPLSGFTHDALGEARLRGECTRKKLPEPGRKKEDDRTRYRNRGRAADGLQGHGIVLPDMVAPEYLQPGRRSVNQFTGIDNRTRQSRNFQFLFRHMALYVNVITAMSVARLLASDISVHIRRGAS